MSDLSVAEAKMTAARRFIMKNQAFFATIMLGLEVEVVDKDMTMATDGKKLWWSVDFVLNQCDQNKVNFVILHEILHVILKHHLRRGKRDPKVWNKAADFMINAIIVKMGMRHAPADDQFRRTSREFFEEHAAYRHPAYRMPKDGLFDPKYLGMSAEEIYDILMKNKKAEPEQGQGQGQGQGQAGDVEDCPWGDVQDATSADGKPLDVKELQEMERALSQSITTAMSIAKGRGQLPSEISKIVEANEAPSQDWEEVLQDLMSNLVPSDLTFTRPNRFHLNSDIIMPSHGREGIGNIAIFSDASGSVTSKEFSQIMSDTLDICENLKPESVTLLQFDSACTAHEVLERGDTPELTRRRNGGTRFSAPFDYAEKHNLMQDFDCIIVFTDGGDDHYAPEPPCPVIWAVTQRFEGEKPPYGTTIKVDIKRTS